MDEEKLNVMFNLINENVKDPICKDEQKIALTILKELQGENISVVGADRILCFCKEAIKFISRVWH